MSGTCSRGESCECVADRRFLRSYCSSWRMDEQPPDAVDEASIENWQRLSDDQRTACIAYLKLKVPKDVRDRWAKQVRRGMRIGSDQARFHFDVGMSIRNGLRDVIPDHLLPAVWYPDGSEARNWDDFYYGALDELARNEGA